MGNECEMFCENNGVECIHHWLIDHMNLGVCKKCGSIKQFSHWGSVSNHRAWCSKPAKVYQDVPVNTS